MGDGSRLASHGKIKDQGASGRIGIVNTARASYGLIKHGGEERPVPLEGTRVRGQLQGLLAEIEITRRYRHDSLQPLKRPVYSFRLPVDALLLGVEVQLGEQQLVSRVVDRSQAAEDIRETEDNVRSAIWLEQSKPGLYRLTLGHLEPGLSICLVYRFAMLLRYSGRTLRLGLPLGPIPGDHAPQPHPEPGTLNAPLLDLELSLPVELAQSDISSPSHGVGIRLVGEESRIHHLSTQGAERDFLLLIDTQSLPRTPAMLAEDKDGWVVHAAFRPALPSSFIAAPRSLQLLLDCSGSMNGTAIAQARSALLAILEALRPEDRFSLLRFGSSIDALVPNLLPASRHQIDRVRQLVSQIQADLGGTELLAALTHVLEQQVDESCPTDVLIITDGEMWEESDQLSQVIELARINQRRLFAVGVGTKVCIPMLRALSGQTGGALDLVDPGEGMAERIYRHFERLYAPRFTHIQADWPGAPDWAEQPDTAFAGDTLHLFAHYPHRPQGPVILRAEATGHQEVVENVEMALWAVSPGWMTPARYCAAVRLTQLGDSAAATTLALEYQLLSPATACLLAPKSDGEENIGVLSIRPDQPPPDIGGWKEAFPSIMAPLLSSRPEAQAARSCIEIDPLPDDAYRVSGWGEAFEFLAAPQGPPWNPQTTPSSGSGKDLDNPQSWNELLEVFTAFLETATGQIRERRVFTHQGAGLPREWAETLMHLAGRFGSEGKRLLLIAFLNALLEVVPEAFPNKLGRLVHTKAKDLSLPDQVEQRLLELFSLIKTEIGVNHPWGS